MHSRLKSRNCKSYFATVDCFCNRCNDFASRRYVFTYRESKIERRTHCRERKYFQIFLSIFILIPFLFSIFSTYFYFYPVLFCILYYLYSSLHTLFRILISLFVSNILKSIFFVVLFFKYFIVIGRYRLLFPLVAFRARALWLRLICASVAILQAVIKEK